MQTLMLILGILTIPFLVWIVNGFKSPKVKRLQVITLFGKPYAAIANVQGKTINEEAGDEEGDLMDLGKAKKKNGKIKGKRRFNIYFFPWPFKVLTYKFTYNQLKKDGEQEEGDTVIYTNEKTNDIVVSRTGISDYIENRYEYPVVTKNLETKEFCSVDVVTTNVIECKNPTKMLTEINDWFAYNEQTLGGALRGLVAQKSIKELNKIQSEKDSEFDTEMASVNKGVGTHHGLEKYGFKLIKSIFKEYNATDENGKRLLESFTKVEIATNEGNAILEKQKKETEAYLNQTNAEIEQTKKRLLETGKIKVDANGKITELVPDANTKATADSLAKLAELRGTLVIGADTATRLNLNNKGGE